MTSDTNSENPQPLRHMPSPKQQQWGALMSIIIIVLMIVIGAFYSWNKRVSQDAIYTETDITEAQLQ